MIKATFDFRVEDTSGAELRFHTLREQVEFVTSDGDVNYFRPSDMLDIWSGRDVGYFHVPGKCILLIGELGENVLCVHFNRKFIAPVVSIRRTEFVLGGFVYSDWFDIQGGPVLAYELGICKFNCEGELVWRVDFDEFLITPFLEVNCLVYREDFGDIIYSLDNGARL